MMSRTGIWIAIPVCLLLGSCRSSQEVSQAAPSVFVPIDGRPISDPKVEARLYGYPAYRYPYGYQGRPRILAQFGLF